MVKKAQLLFERHRTVIENEYETTSSLSSFVNKHIAIDHEMKTQKAKNKSINKKFLKIDIVVTFMIFGIECLLYCLLYYYKP